MISGPRGDDGAAALTVVLATLLVAALALAGITAVADLGLTAARARAAADAAALGAIGVSPLVSRPASQAADPRAEAERVAAANGAELVAVDSDGWPLRYAVTVTVAPATPWVSRVAGRLRATAAAGVRPGRGDSGGARE